MELSQSTPAGGSPPAKPERFMVVGNLDGVHRGHQAVLRDAASDAIARGLELTILTFHPHPAKVLRQTDVPTLTTIPRKIELIMRTVPSAKIVVEKFNHAWAAQTPEEFAEHVLASRFSARVVMVGNNFGFGKNRSGDFDELTRLGARIGFETRSHPMVGDEQGPWSSSRIRAAIARGDMEEAARMLGRPHMLSGVVVEGDKRGRTIGFPTCNVSDVEQSLPAWGVYAVLVDREGDDGRATMLARGVANIGVRPTVKEGAPRPSVEVHLFDYTGDLYGATLRVHLVSRLREERRFSGLAELTDQIAKDARAARDRLAGIEPDPEAGGAFH